MKKYIFLSILSVLLFACTSGPAAHHESTLELNEGKKWKVNPEMLPHITASRMALEAYMAEPGGDHKALADTMQMHTDALISSCTMKGKDHDVLHQWLHPHLELLKSLKNASASEEVDSSIKALDESFKTFDTYFE